MLRKGEAEGARDEQDVVSRDEGGQFEPDYERVRRCESAKGGARNRRMDPWGEAFLRKRGECALNS